MYAPLRGARKKQVRKAGQIPPAKRMGPQDRCCIKEEEEMSQEGEGGGKEDRGTTCSWKVDRMSG